MHNFLLKGLVLFIITIASCKNRNNESESNRIEVIDSVNIPHDSTILYFPKQEFVINDDKRSKLMGEMMNKWYSSMLFTLHEPILYNAIESTQIYRFTWLRTFHNPMAIRIANLNGKIKLTLKVSSGSGGYKHSILVQDTSFEIKSEDWVQLLAFVKKANFWTMNSLSMNSGKDGAQWILEGKYHNKYKCVSRFSPNDKNDEEFKKCCEKLISLSKLKLKPADIY